MFPFDSIKNAESRENHSLSYADLLNTLPVAVYICDAEGFLTSYNEAAVALWGRRPEIGKELWCGSWKIYSADGTPLPLSKCPMAETLKYGKSISGIEIIIERPDGARFTIIPHPNPLFNAKGKLVGAINMLIDVSQYQALQDHTKELSDIVEALTRSEERYHRMISEVQDYAIILLSRDGIIENWNKGAEQIKGYTEQEAVGKSFSIFYTPEDLASGLPKKLIGLAITDGKANNEGWRVRKDGSKFWASVSITALHDRQGNVVGFSKVTRDLTERRENELRIQKYNEELRQKNELLRRREDQYHRMVSEVEDYVIILLSSDGHILNWNKGAEKIKGYSAEEIVGKHFSIFYPDRDARNGLPAKLLAQAKSHGKALHEGWRVRKDRSSFWGSVVITALHDDQGELIGFTKVTRDLTDKKIADERLRATSAKLEEKNKELERTNEELSSFAYISSHDLQEPLRKIQTFSDRILELEYYNLSEKGKDYFERMRKGAERMQRLIRDILAYSRTTTANKKLEKTDLNDVLAQSKTELEMQILEKNAVIEDKGLPVLQAIPFQVQQLFNNLISNALKFSKPDVPPHVLITAEKTAADTIQVNHTLPVPQYWHIQFQDNGIGFDPVYQKKIFEVFQRLHGRSEYGGTGIGLAICKKIVENHQGILTADSVPGEGATFHIYLPDLD